jgi:hypothetical protein
MIRLLTQQEEHIPWVFLTAGKNIFIERVGENPPSREMSANVTDKIY